MFLDPRLDPSEARLLDSISAATLMEYTAALSTEVRLSGSPEERRALQYAKKLLDSWGYTTQILEHPAYISLPGPAALEVAEIGQISCITHSFAVPTPAAGLSGELVDVGDGSAEDWAKPNLHGKIALVNGLATPGQVLQATQAGTIAQIFINDDHLHEMILSRVWGSPTPEQLGSYPSTPAISILRSDGKRIRAALAAGPVQVQLKTSVETGWRTLPILQADLPGVAEPERFTLFSGHIDSWHYGAMDNASANATMLHIAELFAQRKGELQRGLRLCFWSGHSHGRYAGSTWYVDEHWDELYRNCVAHVNIDSVGGKGATVLSEGYSMAETFELGSAQIGRYGNAEFIGTRVGRGGDESFCGVGIPAILMTVSEQPVVEGILGPSALMGGRSGGLGWWWHTTEDTLDKLDPAFLARDAKLYAAVIYRLCAEVILPFDYAATAAELGLHLRNYQERLGERFDLSSALPRSEALVNIAKTMEARVEMLRRQIATGKGNSIDGSAINAALMALGRATIPFNYTAAGPFSHDPALGQPPIPILAEANRFMNTEPGSDQAFASRIVLQRARNQAIYALDQALAAYRAALYLVGA